MGATDTDPPKEQQLETGDDSPQQKVQEAPRKLDMPKEEQPVKGDGGAVAQEKMALPLSDPERLLKHHLRIERILAGLAEREKISIEAAYGWAGDTLDHLANFSEREVPPTKKSPSRLLVGILLLGALVFLSSFALFWASVWAWRVVP